MYEYDVGAKRMVAMAEELLYIGFLSHDGFEGAIGILEFEETVMIALSLISIHDCHQVTLREVIALRKMYERIFGICKNEKQATQDC